MVVAQQADVSPPTGDRGPTADDRARARRGTVRGTAAGRADAKCLVVDLLI
jgi:hypothetical protein